jgi:hypothetical protein
LRPSEVILKLDQLRLSSVESSLGLIKYSLGCNSFLGSSSSSIQSIRGSAQSSLSISIRTIHKIVHLLLKLSSSLTESF